MFVCVAGSQPPMSSTPLPPLLSATVPAKCRVSQLATEFSNTNLLQTCGDSTRVLQRINMFYEAQLSVSAYDTAWMAMVPTPTSSMEDSPFFPQCARWILDNQLSDGSWGLPLPRRNPSLTKDALSSTLACILALQRWGLGEQQVTRGLRFLDCNSASLTDQKQHVPIGFDIIFPGMIDYARDLGLNLPFRSTDIDAMHTKRNTELTSWLDRNPEGRRAYLAYVSEGIQHSQDWDMVMKYQRKNGSLFNSPSTTAVAFSHLQDPDSLRYLCALLDKFENAAPTIYPLDIRSRLSIVDTLDGLGVARHFTSEIKMLLDQTYRCWLHGDEEIFLDTTTCAMAFRLLRVYGYDVSSDQLSPFSEDCFFNSLEGYLKDKTAVLELHKASQIIFPEEPILEEVNSWTMNFLKQEFCNGSDQPGESISTKVHDALTYPYHVDLDRLVHRRNIHRYNNIDNTWTLKTSYCCPNIGNQDLLKLAAEDFNLCQSIQQKELKQLERWVIENKLDKLSFARQKLGYCYFSAAATFYTPELSDARMSWTKNSVLTTVVDDFFDVEGSMGELVNLVHLLENGEEVDGSTDFCSERVEILVTAVRGTIREVGDRALAWQGRDVTSHIHDMWLELVKSMLKEAEWSRNKCVPLPTMDEYIENGRVSFALLPIVLPALYLVGPKLSEELVSSQEYKNLSEAMNTCGRLLNDWRGFQRETKQGTVNAVSLLLLQQQEGNRSLEDAVEEVKREIERARKQLLRLVLLEEKEKGIPYCCKVLFWNMTKAIHLFYLEDDGYTNEAIVNVAKSIVNEPIHLSPP